MPVLAADGGTDVKNGTRGYEDCVARCAHGFRCRHVLSRADPRRCALLCVGDGAGRPGRRRIWPAILRARNTP
jgi:hypothetical protein